MLENGLAAHGLHVDQLNTVMVMASSEAIRTGVEEKIGVAFVSRLVAADSIKLGRIAEVKLANLDLKQRSYLARNLRRPATRVQSAFCDFVFDPANRALSTSGMSLPQY